MEGEETTGLIVGLIYLAIPLALIVLALIVGRALEKKHFTSIRNREAATAHYPTVPTPNWDPRYEVADSRLVSASVVVSLDHFKKILAHFRNIFGGNVRSYESLLDRAKREAVLRLKEQAPDCHVIVNLRLITSNVASVQYKQKGVAGVEVLAFGTAVRYTDAPPAGGVTT